MNESNVSQIKIKQFIDLQQMHVQESPLKECIENAFFKVNIESSS